MATIGENIKKLRKQAKLTQIELSKLSGVSQSGISDIEKTVNHPSTATLILIAKGLNCSVNDILEGTEKETPINDGSLLDRMIDEFNTLPDEQQKKFVRRILDLSLGSIDNP